LQGKDDPGASRADAINPSSSSDDDTAVVVTRSLFPNVTSQTTTPSSGVSQQFVVPNVQVCDACRGVGCIGAVHATERDAVLTDHQQTPVALSQELMPAYQMHLATDSRAKRVELEAQEKKALKARIISKYVNEPLTSGEALTYIKQIIALVDEHL
jgi:hypothetical protein